MVLGYILTPFKLKFKTSSKTLGIVKYLGQMRAAAFKGDRVSPGLVRHTF